MARLLRIRQAASTDAIEGQAVGLPQEVESFRCRTLTDRLGRRVATVEDDPDPTFLPKAGMMSNRSLGQLDLASQHPTARSITAGAPPMRSCKLGPSSGRFSTRLPQITPSHDNQINGRDETSAGGGDPDRDKESEFERRARKQNRI